MWLQATSSDLDPVENVNRNDFCFQNAAKQTVFVALSFQCQHRMCAAAIVVVQMVTTATSHRVT